MNVVKGILDLTEEQKSFIDYILSVDFHWFYQESVYGNMQIAHCLMFRNEYNLPIPGKINSEDYSMSESIFKSFCNQNNIKVNNILRAAINCTFHSSENSVGIHRDHEFDHNVFLMYLNESSGDTIIYQNGDEIRIPFEQYKCVVFSGEEHTHEFCAPNQRRVVMAFTFN
jgi:hypothetical protein